MFSGEESVRINSAESREEVEDAVADALERLGTVRISNRGRFRIEGGRFDTSWAVVKIEGELSKGRKEGQWNLNLTYQVHPSALCWGVAIIGALFWFLGLLILLAPKGTKGDVQRAISNAIRDARDEIEE